MGSTPPPQSPTFATKSSGGSSSKKNTTSPIEQQQDNTTPIATTATDAQRYQREQTESRLEELSAPELRLLVELRDQEIQALKFELEKYKLALHQSQLDYHNTQRQLTSWRTTPQSTNADRTKPVAAATVVGANASATNDIADDDEEDDLRPFSEIGALLADDEDEGDHQEEATSGRRRTRSDHQELAQETVRRHLPGKPALTDRLSSASLGSSLPATSPRVVFKTGAEEPDDEDDDEDIDVSRLISQSHEIDFDDGDEDLDDIIQDVGEIDLNLELGSATQTNVNKQGAESSGSIVDKQKRLSLQGEQQQQQQQLSDKSCSKGVGGGMKTTDSKELRDNLKLEDKPTEARNNNEDDEDIISDGLLTSLTDAAISNLSQLAALQERCESQQQQHSNPYQQQQRSQQPSRPQQQSRSRQHSNSGLVLTSGGQPTTSPGTTSTAPTTSSPTLGPIGTMNQPGDMGRDPFIANAIANQAALAIASIQPSSSMLIQQSQQPVSSSSSISPTSTIHASDLNSSNSLASVVAAAAVAAAAANDQQLHQNQQQQHHHHTQINPQTRLISSAIPSPEFYHSLHQHHAQQQQNIHQQHPSPVSALHFSPSTSVTPSSSSLLGQSRRSASNASSSLMSPISSPNYLRRQFLPERLPLLSPSPTSGLTTGSSSAASGSLAHILTHHQHQQRSASALAGPMTASTSSTPLGSSGSTAVSPLMSNKNSSQARLNNMQIRHKFGYLGSGRAQFNSPHGFCLGLNQEIVVADTNNHRVCIFDKSGSYITQFGSPGKEEGQLWNPRKVAILHRPTSGSSSVSQTASSAAANQNQLHQQLSHLQHHHQQTSSPYSSHHINSSSLQGSGQLLGASSTSEALYVVCDRGAERSRMQLFTKDGAFIKKIGIHYIDIVAGLAITQNGLIIVVDSVSPTVYIINGETGILNGWFDCSGHMKEPSDIAVKSDVPGNEYFICDFKGHCVVVFSETGEYLRKIGHDGLTSYPNGIDISDDGDILVGDSHGNRFHVVVFDRNGNFVSQFECPHVKVSRCCGLKITREGYIVTLAKNNHHVLVLDTIHI